MSDKELLKTIQNDIKNIDKCIEMAISVESINYLKSIKKNLREQEIKLVKQMSIKKALNKHITLLLFTTKALFNLLTSSTPKT